MPPNPATHADAIRLDDEEQEPPYGRRVAAFLWHYGANTVEFDRQGYACARAVARELRLTRYEVLLAVRTSHKRGIPRFEAQTRNGQVHLRAPGGHSNEAIEGVDPRAQLLLRRKTRDRTWQPPRRKR